MRRGCSRGRVGAPRARAAIEGSCAKGHISSCSFAGILRRDAIGGPADLPTAIRNFETACSGGNAMACQNLASVYWTGKGRTIPVVKWVDAVIVNSAVGEPAAIRNKVIP